MAVFAIIALGQCSLANWLGSPGEDQIVADVLAGRGGDGADRQRYYTAAIVTTLYIYIYICIVYISLRVSLLALVAAVASSYRPIARSVYGVGDIITTTTAIAPTFIYFELAHYAF